MTRCSEGCMIHWACWWAARLNSFLINSITFCTIFQGTLSNLAGFSSVTLVKQQGVILPYSDTSSKLKKVQILIHYNPWHIKNISSVVFQYHTNRHLTVPLSIGIPLGHTTIKENQWLSQHLNPVILTLVQADSRQAAINQSVKGKFYV